MVRNMFSHNGKISIKQMRIMLTLPVFSGSIFVVPHLLARMYGKYMLVGVAAYVVMAALYMGLIMSIDVKQVKIDGKGYVEHRNIRNDKAAYSGTVEKCATGKVIAAIQIARNIIRLVFYILLAVTILAEGQVPFVRENADNSFGNLLILLPLLAVALYGADRNVEKQGRINEMIYMAAFFPYIVMMVLGLKNVSGEAIHNMLEAAGHCLKNAAAVSADGINAGPLSVDIVQGANGTGLIRKIVVCGYALLTFSIPVENYLWLKSTLKTIRENNSEMVSNNKESLSRISDYITVMASPILVGVLSIIMACIYGVNGMAQDNMASIAIMRYIELPLGVLQRFDMLMVWFFMTGCYVLIASILYTIRRQLFAVLKPETARIMLFVLFMSAYIIAYMMPGYGNSLYAYVVYGACVDVPLSLILAVVGMITGRREASRIRENHTGNKTPKRTGHMTGHRTRRGTVSRTQNRIRSRIPQKLITIILIISIPAFLTGCTSDIENVEQRDYATILMAEQRGNGYHFTLGIAKEHHAGEKNDPEQIFGTDAANVDELTEIYGSLRGKDLSLSHLKVLMWSGDIDTYEDMNVEVVSGAYPDNEYIDKTDTEVYMYSLMNYLCELNDNNEIAKTCPFLITTDSEGIIAYMYDSDNPVGTYITNLIRTARRNGKRIPALMDYLKMIREGEMIDVYQIARKGDDLYLLK